MEFNLRPSSIGLHMMAGFPYKRNENYHRFVFRFLSLGVCLLCMEPSHGLLLNNQDPALTVVPVGLPTDITIFNLGSNEISEIGANRFTGISSVRRLDLSRNRITYIDNNAFLPCAVLLVLRLNENRLKYLPPTLGPNSPNMEMLNIMDNPSCLIEESWFRQYRSLQWLLMENVGMRELPNDFFTGLVSLENLQISETYAPNLTERTSI